LSVIWGTFVLWASEKEIRRRWKHAFASLLKRFWKAKPEQTVIPAVVEVNRELKFQKERCEIACADICVGILVYLFAIRSNFVQQCKLTNLFSKQRSQTDQSLSQFGHQKVVSFSRENASKQLQSERIEPFSTSGSVRVRKFWISNRISVFEHLTHVVYRLNWQRSRNHVKSRKVMKRRHYHH
jgi:hypothetical protein